MLPHEALVPYTSSKSVVAIVLRVTCCCVTSGILLYPLHYCAHMLCQLQHVVMLHTVSHAITSSTIFVPLRLHLLHWHYSLPCLLFKVLMGVLCPLMRHLAPSHPRKVANI